jgi:hypothetical protein
MDLQPQTLEHGIRWHLADAEIGARRLAPLLLSVKNGGGLPLSPTRIRAAVASRHGALRTFP